MSTAQLSRRSSAADGRYEHHRHARRMLNVPLLLISLATVAAAIPAVYFWHGYQTERTSSSLLDRAAKYEKDGNFESAAAYLHRFIQMHPGDADVRVRLAKVYDRSAGDPARKKRAVELYFQAIGLTPDDVDLRKRQAELLLEQQQFSAADDQVKEALKRKPKDAALLRLKAYAIYGQARAGGRLPMEQAIKAVMEAIALDPASVELSVLLATVYREENLPMRPAERQQAADAVMDRLIEADHDSADAYLARHRYRMRYNLAGASSDVETALILAPRSFYVLLAAADNALRQGAAPAALDFYQRAIDAEPAQPEGYAGLAELQISQGKIDEALEVLRKGLASCDPRHRQLNIRLAEALMDKGRLAEAEAAVRVVRQGAEGQLAQLSGAERQVVQGQIDYIQARLHVSRKEFLQAIPLLRKSVVSRSAASWLMLGQCYTAINQWDQAASAYEQAAQLLPRSSQVRALVGHARTMAENLELAIHNFQQALVLEDNPDVWLALARAQLEYQMRLPAPEQDWPSVDKALLAVRTAQAEGRKINDLWQADLIQAGLTVMRGAEDEPQRIETAVAFLRGVEPNHAQTAPFWHDAAQFYDRLDMTADADRACDAYDKLAKDVVGGALLRAKLLCRRQQTPEAAQVLTAAAAKVDGAARIRLQSNLVDLDLLQGKVDAARRSLREMAEKNPGHYVILDKLANLAIASRDFREAEKWEQQLRDLEGASGVQWRYHQARRLLAESTEANDPRFIQAVSLQSQLENARPGWSATQLLKGLIAERQNKPDVAIDAYRSAIRQGEQRLAVYERLIPLLYRQGRVAETEQLLTKLQDFVPMSRELSGLAMSFAVQNGQVGTGVEVAQRGVELHPDEPEAWMQLGRMLWAANEPVQAEKAFAEAVETAPAEPQTWSALVSFHLASKQNEALKKTLGRLEDEDKLPAGPRSFILAQAYERLGMREQAALHYRVVEEKAQGDSGMLTRAATFALSEDPLRAEKLFRAVLAKNPDAGDARRALAGVLAARGGDDEWKEAQALLEDNRGGTAGALMTERFRAVLLAERGGAENRKRARMILEKLVENSQQVVPGDRLLLARLYDEDQLPQAARQQFLLLVSGDKPDPAYVARYVDYLLRRKHAEEAMGWLSKIESAAQPSWELVTLKARCLKESGRQDEVEGMVEKFFDSPQAAGADETAKIQQLEDLGVLYTTIEMHAEAEGAFRRLYEAEPTRFAPLAKCLIRQEKVDPALELCSEAARAQGSAESAATLAAVLSLAQKSGGEKRGLAESTLEELVRRHANQADVLFALANLRVAQERTAEAISLYEKVVRIEPKHYTALNNLAFMLSEDPERRNEALKYVDQAIQIAGPAATLLDTKAMVLVSNGQPAKAVPLLERITTTHAHDPRFHLHLALAYRKMGAQEKAAAALKQMKDADLDSHVLTPEDKKLLAELR